MKTPAMTRLTPLKAAILDHALALLTEARLATDAAAQALQVAQAAEMEANEQLRRVEESLARERK